MVLQSDHEEADSRIFVHCEHFSKRVFSERKLNLQELWFHSLGRQKRFIPIHSTVANLGPRLCNLLPALGRPYTGRCLSDPMDLNVKSERNLQKYINFLQILCRFCPDLLKTTSLACQTWSLNQICTKSAQNLHKIE